MSFRNSLIVKVPFILLIFYNFFSINCYSQKKDAQLLDYISGEIVNSFNNGDSVQTNFYTSNKSRIENISYELTRLPIDRCHHGKLFITIAIDSAGNTTDVVELNESINPKLDSLVITTIQFFPGLWFPAQINGRASNYRSNFNFVLLSNRHSHIKAERNFNESYNPHSYTTTRTLKYTRTKTYDESNDCEQNEFFYNTGVEEFKNNNFKKAKYNFSEAVSANPFDTDAIYNLGLTEIKLGKTEDACRIFNKAIEYGDTQSVKAIIKYCK